MTTKQAVVDPCAHCGESTAFGSGNFVNRLGWDEGWSCAMCAGYECDACDKQIYLDADWTLEPEGYEHADEGHYHWECLPNKSQELFKKEGYNNG